jgi:molybdopterin converting factor small subunit
VGYNPRNLIGRRGSAVSFTLNGRKEIAGGEPGEPAVIYLNDSAAGLDKPVANGDRIIVEPAVEGKPAEVFVRDYMDGYTEKSIYVIDDPYIIKPLVSINGSECSIDTLIRDGDEISIKYLEKVFELFEHLDLSYYDTEVYINGKKAGLDETINNGDIITYKTIEKAPNGSETARTSGTNCVNVILNGKPVVVQTNKSQCLFVDIFNYIDINVKNVKGTIVMLLNGNKANYTDVLNDGDNIELYWDEK